jgi:hypothetical protein
MRNFIVTILCIFALQSLAFASPLSLKEIERLKEVKRQLKDVDTKPLMISIKELERTKYPSLHLRMREAMARVYLDVAEELKVKEQKKKDWLYSMVVLNMAYLQFDGGGKGDSKTEPLNQLIRRKLIKELTPEVLEHPGFHYSID